MLGNNQKKGTLLYLVLLSFHIVSLTAISGCDQRSSRDKVVGIINPSAGMEEVVRGFRSGMEKHGYKEGSNVTYIYDGPVRGVNEIDAKVKEMLAKRVDLIYTLTTPATKRVKSAVEGTSVPVVFGPVHDPVSSGIVASLADPGGQITGIKVRGSTPKALEWLRAIAPGIKVIYVPFHVADEAACMTVDDLRETAGKFGIRVVTENVADAKDLERALGSIPKNADAIWMTCSHMLLDNVDKIVKASIGRRIPTASSTHSPYKNGILISYGENDFRLGEDASRLANKLLKGVPPSSVPVETAEYFLGLNLRTAQAIGIDVPPEIMVQADFIVR